MGQLRLCLGRLGSDVRLILTCCLCLTDSYDAFSFGRLNFFPSVCKCLCWSSELIRLAADLNVLLLARQLLQDWSSFQGDFNWPLLHVFGLQEMVCARTSYACLQRGRTGPVC